MYPELRREAEDRRRRGRAAQPARGRAVARRASKRSIPIRTTARSTCCRCATTSTCWSATAATSSCRPAIRARSSWIPAQGSCRTRCSRRSETLTPKPIQFIANTSFHADHTGGNGEARRRGHGPQPARLVLRHSGSARRHRLLPDPLRHATMLAHNNVNGSHAGRRRRRRRRCRPTRISRTAAASSTTATAIELFHVPNASTDGDSLVALPPRRRDRGRRHLHDDAVPVHRREERRHRPGRDQRAERDPGPHGLRAPRRGRHLRRARPRLSQRRARGGRVSRHGGDRSRSREGDDRTRARRWRRSRRPASPPTTTRATAPTPGRGRPRCSSRRSTTA